MTRQAELSCDLKNIKVMCILRVSTLYSEVFKIIYPGVNTVMVKKGIFFKPLTL